MICLSAAAAPAHERATLIIAKPSMPSATMMTAVPICASSSEKRAQLAPRRFIESAMGGVAAEGEDQREREHEVIGAVDAEVPVRRQVVQAGLGGVRRSVCHVADERQDPARARADSTDPQEMSVRYRRFTLFERPLRPLHHGA